MKADPGVTSAGVDEALASRLRPFAQALLDADNPRESVAVSVRRTERFTNEATTERHLRITLDEPEDFGGTGRSPDPAEYLLAAIGASVSVTLTAHAALRGLAIEGVEVSLGGSIDGRSFFEPRAWPHTGILDLTIDLTIQSSASPAEVQALVDRTIRASPVLRSLKRRPKFSLSLEKPRLPC